jgi:YggT family protein
MLFRVTEPIIDPFRRILPQSGMIDLSPLAAIFALIILSITFNSLAVAGQ